MLTEQHIEECLSKAHIEAVAAHAGVSVHYRGGLDYGVDGTFHPIQIRNNRRVEAGYPIDFQAKATINYDLTNDDVIYVMEAKSYNDLVDRTKQGGATPLLLILLLLPQDRTQWVKFSEHTALLKRCCYWKKLDGDQTPNKKSITIRISRGNHFTSEALKSLIEARKAGKL